MSGKSKKITKQVLLYVLLIVLALIWIVPIFTLIATSLKHKKDFMSGLSLFQLPAEIAWDNFTNAIIKGRLITYMKNDRIFSEGSSWNFCWITGRIFHDKIENQTQYRNFRIFPDRYDASDADGISSDQYDLQQTWSFEYIFWSVLRIYRIWIVLLYPCYERIYERNPV